jgi:hypothetical protein
MSEVSNSPETRAVPAGRRIRASGPILILAAMFVAATFLAWYFTWFGRGLSDADISKYLADTKNPRHAQHALLQVQQRMERGDTSARNWYPQIQALSQSPETEFRLTVAWLMGFDNQSKDFHETLLRLVRDQEPIVRRNAALALVRFNDNTGREQLVSMLKPYDVNAAATGQVASTLHGGSEVSRGALLARIRQSDGNVTEVRSPLPGKINEVIRANGSQVNQGETLLTINSDEGSIWEALRGLSFVGTKDDLPTIQAYSTSESVSDRVREQAKLTAKAIEGRKF